MKIVFEFLILNILKMPKLKMSFFKHMSYYLISIYEKLLLKQFKHQKIFFTLVGYNVNGKLKIT